MQHFIEFGPRLSAAQRRKRGLVVGVFVAFVAATLLYPLLPMESTTLCPFRWATGFSCPGCGMTRACVHLMHGHFGASFASHPFGWLFVLGFALVAVDRLMQLVAGRRLSYPGRRYWESSRNPVLIGCLVAVGAFGGVRLVLELAGFLTPI
jgi:hypothetical protein